MRHGTVNILRRMADQAIRAVLAAASLFAASCTKDGSGYGPEDEGNFINFYLKGTATKALIDNTDDLIALKQDIVVTDESANPAFSNTAVHHFQNNIWRSDKTWTAGKTYSLFAYIASDKPVEGGSAVHVEDSGRKVTVIQPTGFLDGPDFWADYLLSYRVSANGSDKPLVQMEFERVTAAVELYMTKGPNMYDVIVDEATFSNIATFARMTLYEHGVLNANDADPVTGMKNKWTVDIDGTKRYPYSYKLSQDLHLSPYDGTKDRFDESYRIMRFLTVPQTVMSGSSPMQLTVKYRIKEREEDQYREGTSVFDLAQYSPDEWMIGHKIKYYVNIDSSTELTGVIDEWKQVDFIEGVLLPK